MPSYATPPLKLDATFSPPRYLVGTHRSIRDAPELMLVRHECAADDQNRISEEPLRRGIHDVNECRSRCERFPVVVCLVYRAFAATQRARPLDRMRRSRHAIP